MSTIELILSRMMNETDFAEAVFADAEMALVKYNLLPEEIAKFRDISRADFEALTSSSPEERKSFSRDHNILWGDYFLVDPAN